MLRRKEREIKKCVSNAKVNTTFQFAIDKGSTKFTKLIQKPRQKKNNCLKRVLNGSFRPAATQLTLGSARFKIASTKGITGQCNVSINITQSIGNMKMPKIKGR